MAVSVYSYLLDTIRRGASQILSYNLAISRFIGTAPSVIYNNWLAAWSGNYVANQMERNRDETFGDYRSIRPTSNIRPPISASADEIQSWFGTVNTDPYDMQIITTTITGPTIEYNTWRYRANDDSTYSMFMRTTEGIIMKQYLRGGDGKITPVSQYFITTPMVL
jgi:hypothetical protein